MRPVAVIEGHFQSVYPKHFVIVYAYSILIIISWNPFLHQKPKINSKNQAENFEKQFSSLCQKFSKSRLINLMHKLHAALN